jgi:spermidine/putrescine transport system ATP-binding protein
MSLLVRADARAGAELGAAPLSQGAAEMAVDIQAVRKCYGPVVAVDDVDLAIRRGEFFSLLGPSGCGKTSLLRMIGGFESIDGGQILLDGEDISSVPAYARNTNMIFQNLALFPHMTVLENVAFGLRRKRVPRAEIGPRVDAALRLVQLETLGNRLPDQLSGGQRQRVAMARALINRPSVLLLDEPLGALDLQLRIAMQEELRRLHRALGNTFIFVTHDQGEAMSMSDRIAIMNRGRIQQIGTPEEIYESPTNRFVAAFVGHTNLLEGVVTGLESGVRVVLDCAGLSIPCRSARRMEIGQKATAALRYEKVSVASESSPEAVRLDGVVTDRTYLGNAVRLTCQLGDRLALTAEIPDVASVRGLNAGDRVGLAFRVDAAVAVPD